MNNPGVVGVILNLAVWFGLHVLRPTPTTLDWFAVGICVVSFIGLIRWKWDVIPVVCGASIAGILYRSFL
jgi:chromate transporter